MPSSTSSSRAVDGPWLRTWLLVMAIAGGALGLLEFRLRELGHMAAVKQDSLLWSMHRHRVYTSRRIPVAVVGSSRISAGFDPAVFNERYPELQAVMLARPGRAGVATLVDLANDEDFHGVVIYAASPDQLLRRSRKEQRGLVRGYHKTVENYGYLNRFANRWMSAQVDDVLVFRAVRIDVPNWLWDLVRGEPLAAPEFMVGRADGYRKLDFSKTDIVKHSNGRLQRRRRKFRKRKAPRPRQYRKQTRYVEEAIEKLQARGVKVVVVRYPVSEQWLQLDEKHYPRAKYWDPFVERIDAPAIHFSDYESLSGYECPDHSHLDVSDAPRFTLALAAEIEELGIFDP